MARIAQLEKKSESLSTYTICEAGKMRSYISALLLVWGIYDGSLIKPIKLGSYNM
jgi:hypothetical protein